MSDNSQIIVDVDAGHDEEKRLARDVRAWLASEEIIRPRPSDWPKGGTVSD